MAFKENAWKRRYDVILGIRENIKSTLLENSFN